MLLPYLSIGRRICEEQRKLGVSQGASDDMLSISSGAARPLLVMSGCENELDSLSLCGKICFRYRQNAMKDLYHSQHQEQDFELDLVEKH